MLHHSDPYIPLQPNGTITKVVGKSDINASLNEILTFFDTIRPIGIGIETISGTKYVIIEELDYFYSNSQYTEIVTKGDVTDIVRELNQELFYSKISNAFSIISNDSDLGLSDYSGKVEYTSPLNNFNNSYDKTSIISISPADIERARANPVSGRGADNNELDTDDAIFMIDCYRDGATITSRDQIEGWTSVDTSSIYGTNKLYTNLRLRPTANIYNHGRWIKIGLQYNDGEVLRIQNSQKLSKAKTQWGGDSFEIEDGANISIDDFREPLITGYKYTMKINASSSFLVEFLSPFSCNI